MHHAVSSYSRPSGDAEVLRRYGGIVRRAALAVAARTGADPDELWSVGAWGLLEAVRRFDASQGVRLESFVAWRVRGAMLDELRRMDRLPRRTRGRVGALEKARASLAQDLGRAPTREELAEATGEDPEDVDRLNELKEQHAPLDDVELPAAEGSIEELVVTSERASELRQAIAQLPDRQKTVLSLRYVEELTLREVAQVLGVSEPRVCQIHNAAVIKLRQLMS